MNKETDTVINKDFRKSQLPKISLQELQELKIKAYQIFGNMEKLRKKLKLKFRNPIYQMWVGDSNRLAHQVKYLIELHEKNSSSKAA